jgi:ABC-2 type transport system permease protein
MSLAEAPERATLGRLPRLNAARSLRFARSELGMVFRRRRNQALLTVLACVPILIAVAIKVSGGSGGGNGNGAALFGSITDNGIFVAYSALFVVMPFFLPMAVSVVAGDSVSGEANTGTLRYLLAVPVGRSRLLAVKYAGIVAWCIACSVVVAFVGVLIGLILFGGGDVTLLSGTSVSFASGLGRLAIVAAYVAANIAAVGAIGLFVSTLTEVPIAAMATTLGLTITSQVLDAVPQISAIHPWLLSHYWQQFIDVLRDPMALDKVGHGLLASATYAVLFLSMAWARFNNKDVSS